MPARVACYAPALVASLIGGEVIRVLVFRFVAAVLKALGKTKRMMRVDGVVRMIRMVVNDIVESVRFVAGRDRVGASVRVCGRGSGQRHDQLCSCVWCERRGER